MLGNSSWPSNSLRTNFTKTDFNYGFKMSKKQKKTDKDIETSLVYKPSPEANFRLSQALNMLVSEEDIRNYLLTKNGNFLGGRHKIAIDGSAYPESSSRLWQKITN